MIQLIDIAVRQGQFVLPPVSLRLAAGEYGALMGRTGSGKTTLLEVACGLRRPAAGRVLVGGRDVSMLLPAARAIGYVPQDRALFPTMTVADQLAFAPRLQRWTEREIADQIATLAADLQITHLLNRYPQALSGGESQRVALGRALAMRPAVLLLDEPLAALDEPTRDEMYDLLEAMHKRTNVTVLHVTHSRDEARRLAQRTFLLGDNGLAELHRAELARAAGSP